MANWPVKSSVAHAAHADIQDTHSPVPLPVFTDHDSIYDLGRLVLPTHYEAALGNVIAEVSFTLVHKFLKNRDWFGGVPTLIRILQAPPSLNRPKPSPKRLRGTESSIDTECGRMAKIPKSK